MPGRTTATPSATPGAIRPTIATGLSSVARTRPTPTTPTQGTQLKGIQATGTATLDGTPLEMGLIVFEPEGGGESSSSQITKDGSFKLYDIKPGRYKVAVMTSMYSGMANQGKKAAATAGEGRPVAVRDLEGTLRAVPAKTEKAATLGLVAEVKAGQPITIAIDSK